MKREHLTSDEDVDAILKIAVRKAGVGGDDLRSRLSKAANELGIPPDVLRAAEEEYSRTHVDKRELAEYERRKRMDFKGHFAIYCIVIAFLFALNIFTEMGDSNFELWAVYPMLGWGIGVAIHGFTALIRRTQPDDEEFLEWRAKRRGEPRRRDDDDD